MARQHEFQYRIPADGSAVSYQPPFSDGAKSVELVNGTNQTLYAWDDQEYAWAVPSGKVLVVGLENSQTFHFQLSGAAALINGRPPILLAIFYDTRRPTSGDLAQTGATSALHARVGTEANLWNAAVTGVAGNSNVFDALSANALTVMGNSSGATTISLQASADGAAFYTVAQSVLAGAGNFGFTIAGAGARYWRLQSSASVTATATAMGAA